MKVCILSHCFYPSRKRGGPTVSVTNMVKSLAERVELSVVTVAYDKDSSTPYSEVSIGKNRLFGADVYYLSENTATAFYNCISEISPDIIYVSSLFSRQYSLPALRYAKTHKGVRLIIAPRGELMPSALKRKKAVKSLFLCVTKPQISKCAEFHVTSDEECAELKKRYKKSRVWQIKNLPSRILADHDREKKAAGELRMVTVGRVHPIKNVDYAISLLHEIKGRVTFDIYGPEEEAEYVSRCKHLADSLPENITVHFKGIIDHDAVGSVLSGYQVFLAPTQSENYGHSIIEALLAGLPAVISNNTPWHELERNNAGFDLPLERRDLFVKGIQQLVDMDEESYRRWSEGAESYISSRLAIEETIDEYVRMFTERRDLK